MDRLVMIPDATPGGMQRYRRAHQSSMARLNTPCETALQ